MVGPDGRLVRSQVRPSGKHGFLVEYTPHLAGIGCDIISQLQRIITFGGATSSQIRSVIFLVYTEAVWPASYGTVSLVN